MEGLIILLIILSLLFIIEYKSINTLANFIGIIIIIAIILALYNCDYLSFILILVQISALTILFGFIIMLFPKNNTIPHPSPQQPFNSKFIYKFEIRKGYKYILCTIIISLLIKLLNYYPSVLYYNYFSDSLNLYYNQFSYPFSLLSISNSHNFLFKLGGILYNSIYSIVFIVLIIFLLFAIIALFYLLIPTI